MLAALLFMHLSPCSCFFTSLFLFVSTPLLRICFPWLPCRPDVRDGAAIAAWIKALPEFKEAMDSYVDTVQSLTDGAIKDCETYMMQLQVQRSRIKAEADAYIKALLAQGQEVVAGMSGDKQQQAPPPRPPSQQQQQAAVKQEGVPPAAAAAEQQQASGPQPDQQQQQERVVHVHVGSDKEVDAKTTSRQPGHASSSDLDKQQQDQGAAVDAAPAANGPAPDSTEPSQQPPQQQDAARHSQQQQQDQQQTEQPAAAGHVDLTSPLPFPGGPLNKWLAPRLQVGACVHQTVLAEPFQI